MGSPQKNDEFEEMDQEESFHKMPLSADAWLTWLKDLIEDKVAKEEIEALFEKAIFDSNDIQLWLEIIQWSIGLGDMNYTKQKLESAVQALGLRVDVGSLIWQSYLDIEELVTQGDEEKVEKMTSLFKRALRVPTEELKAIYDRYCEFTGGNPADDIKTIFENTQKQLEECLKFEAQLRETDNSIDTFCEYLNYEMESGDPNRIQSFYERLVSVFNQDDSVWMNYGSWVEQTLKNTTLASRIYERAVRHCPYSAGLWQQLLLALERAHAESEKIDSFWEKAKETISTAGDGRALYRSYLYLLRRRAASSDKDYSKMAEVFEDGKKTLTEYFENDWDPKMEYRKNYAHFALSLLKDVNKVRELWKDILASGGGRFAEKWLEGIHVERQIGDIPAARKMFYKALNSVSDHPNLIYEAFIQFEREEGTLTELDLALEKVNNQVRHRSSRPQKKEEKGRKSDEHQRPNDKEKKKDRKRPSDTSYDAPTKKPAPTKENGAPTPTKDKDGFAMPSLPITRPPKAASKSDQQEVEQSSAAPSSLDGKFTVFVSNLDFKVTPDEITSVLEGTTDVRLLYRGTSKLHKGYGYVDFDSEASMKRALSMDRTPINGRPMLISVNDPEKRQTFKYGTGLEKNKVFVRNVHYDCTEEQLRGIFSDFGEVKDVRVVQHKSGKSKGCAYVDFATEEAATKAINAEITLLERRLSVALSNPPKKADPNDLKLPEITAEGRKASLQIVPRSLAGKGRPAPSKPLGKNMSNDQFRNLFK